MRVEHVFVELDQPYQADVGVQISWLAEIVQGPNPHPESPPQTVRLRVKLEFDCIRQVQRRCFS